MTTPRLPHEDDDFRQLTGAFDRPIAPSPLFAESLKARLESETAAQETIAVQAKPVSQRTARVASAQPVRRRKWMDVAIAAALIVAMLGGSFWYANVRVGDGGPGVPDATRYAAQPLASDATPAFDSQQVAGDPGKINAWPAGFEPEADLDMSELAEEIAFPSYAVIASDTIIVQGSMAASGENQTESIVAIDLDTGSIRWNVPLTAKREFVTDGKSIFGFFADPGRTDITLMSISVEDGEFRWRGPTFDGEDTADLVASVETMNLFGPTLVGHQLFFRTPEADVVAVDADTGEKQWSLTSDATANASQPMPGSLVSDGQYLYEIDRERSLRKISLEDGTAIERIEPELENGEFLAWMFATEQELLVVSKAGNSDPQQIHALSSETGETLWRQPLGEVRPYITATNDIVAVPHYVPNSLVGAMDGEIDEAGLYVSFFDLGSGALTSLQRPSTGDFATLSSSGDVVCINQGNAVSCTDTANRASTLVTLPYAPGEGSYDPVMFHGDAAIIRGGERGLVIVRPKDAQPQQDTGPTLPGDPGNTNAYPETIDLSRTYTAESFGEVDMGAHEMVVVGDDLVFVGGALTDATNLSIANPTLMSRDIATGKHNWSYQKPGVHVWPQQLATDGEHVYAVLFNPNLPMTYRLIALDGETGDVRWETETLHTLVGVEPSDRYSTGIPVAVGNLVLVSYGPETLLALDRESGEIAWTLAPDEGESLYPENAYLGGSPVVANETTAFRGLPDGSVEEVDLATGSVRSVILGPDDQSLITNMTLHLQGDSLVIKRETTPDGGSVRNTLDVHNVSTREGGWTITTTGSLGAVVATPDLLVVTESTFRQPTWLEQILPFVDPPLPTTRLLAFDLATGEEIALIQDTGFDFPPSMSAAGGVLCLATETLRCIDRDGNEMVVEGYEVENYIPHNPPVYWEGQIVVGNGMGPLTIAKPGS